MVGGERKSRIEQELVQVLVKSYVAIGQEPFLYISGHLHTMRVLLLLILLLLLLLL